MRYSMRSPYETAAFVYVGAGPGAGRSGGGRSSEEEVLGFVRSEKSSAVNFDKSSLGPFLANIRKYLLANK